MSTHQEIEEQAAQWLARQDGEHWSSAQEQALEDWKAESTAHRVAYLRLAASWNAAAPLPHKLPAAAPGNGAYWRIAAGLVLAVGAALLINFGGATPGTVLQTPVGGNQHMALADGSEIVLNTATLLRSKVNKRERTVWLERGEVYFSIAPDPKKPFVVVAGNSRITVLGTRFLVRTQDGKTEVDVVEGRVRVEPIGNANEKSAMVLTANQRVIAVPGKLIRSSQSEAQLENTLSWRERKLVFDQVSLEHAAGEFNRYNTTQLLIADAEARKVVIGGRFDVDNVQGFARLLHNGFGLQVTQAPGQIVISTGDKRTP
ncbi:MAG: FecR domain-containing protein [Pseudomonadota bacterium]